MAVVALLAASRLGQAQEFKESGDPRPATGIDILGGGIGLAAFGALSLATASVCETSVVIAAEQSPCVTVSLAIGIPTLVTGISLITIGSLVHAKYNRWLEKHPALKGLDFAASAHKGSLWFALRF